MAKWSKIDDTHWRKTGDNGRWSTVYRDEQDGLSSMTPVEECRHNEDGSTDSYDYDDSFVGSLLGNKGDKRND